MLKGITLFTLDLGAMVGAVWLYTHGHPGWAYVVGAAALLFGLGAATDWLFYTWLFEGIADFDLDL